MTAGFWPAWVAGRLDEVRAAGRWRAPRDLDAGGPAARLVGDGGDGAPATPVVSFASNDYLGLSQHPAVVAAAHEALDRFGAGSGAARLIVGSRPVHGALETALAEWKGEEAAVLFSTGFMANLGVLATFGGPGVRILSDELNHASIIDGCRLAAADVAVYRHSDVDHVEALLAAGGEAPAIVVTDTVFSMDGDLAPVEALAEACARHGALLVLDEAHAVLGPNAALDGVDHLRVGTLSKTLGSLGGFVAGPRPFVDLLVNRARSYIFTTASSPPDTATRSRQVPGATVGGRMAGTSRPRSSSAAAAASARSSEPSTTGTIGDGCPGATTSTFARSLATSPSPSAERRTPSAARAAAVSGGLEAVVKM